MKNFLSFREYIQVGGRAGVLLSLYPVILYLIGARQRDNSQYASVDFAAFVFILYAFVCFIFAVRDIYKDKTNLSKNTLLHSPIFWFLLYTIWGGVSTMWSVNYSLTAFRTFECLAMALIMLVTLKNILTRSNTLVAIQWTLIHFSIYIFCSMIRRTIEYPSIGFVLQASQMVGTVFLYMALYNKCPLWMKLLYIVIFVFSLSTVSYIGFAVGLISVLWVRGNKKYFVYFAALIASVYVLSIGTSTFIKDTIFFDKQSISIEETSGRNHIMDVVVQALDQEPLGYGFFAGEPYVLYQHFSAAINGHNSFFSAAMGLGYPGIVLIGIFFFSFLPVLLSRYIPPQHKSTIIGCFCMGFLHSMGNPGVGSRIYGSWMPVMYLFILISTIYTYNKYYKKHKL